MLQKAYRIGRARSEAPLIAIDGLARIFTDVYTRILRREAALSKTAVTFQCNPHCFPPFVGLPLLSVRKKSRIFAPYSQIRWKTGNDLRHLLCSKVVEREPGDDFRALELGTRGELSNLSSFQRRPYQYHLTWQEKLSIPRYLLRPQPDVTPATTAVAQPDVTPATTAAG